MINLPEATPIKETEFPFPEGYHLSLAPQLDVGAHEPLPPDVIEC